MPRQPRVQAAGLYHVWNHAVENTPLYTDERDFGFRLELVERAVRAGHVRCHAFCLMGNHDHFILSTLEDGRLAPAMQRFNRTYAGTFNYWQGRRGRLFAWPYGSKSILSDEYLQVLTAYLTLNPEWAHRGRADDYEWSSYRGLIGRHPAMSFVDPTPLLDAVGGGDRAISLVMELVADGRVLGRKRIERRL